MNPQDNPFFHHSFKGCKITNKRQPGARPTDMINGLYCSKHHVRFMPVWIYLGSRNGYRVAKEVSLNTKKPNATVRYLQQTGKPRLHIAYIRYSTGGLGHSTGGAIRDLPPPSQIQALPRSLFALMTYSVPFLLVYCGYHKLSTGTS